MKLAVILLMLSTVWMSVKSDGESTNKVTRDELLKRAASQLERLSAFRRIRELEISIPEISPDDNKSEMIILEANTDKETLEAKKRIDELRQSASAVLHDPRYAQIMQDRIKRSFISGFANKLIGGAIGAVSGASRGISGLSSSNSPGGYGSYGHSYESQFSLWDFKKAIINTLIQAIKAIGGGAIAGGGALIKGGGYLVAAKGRIISSAGDAISTLGKSLASSAIVASSKPVYGPPGYSYGPPAIYHPDIDHTYDGPPPSEGYAGPEDAYNAGHSSYAAPSNDDGVDNNAGVVLVKETKPGHDEGQTATGQENEQKLTALEESFGGPTKGTTTITKIIGILNSAQPTTDDHSHQHKDEHANYYPEHKDQQPPSISSPPESSYDISSHNIQENINNDNHLDDHTNKQIYDSYGTKLESSSSQFPYTQNAVNHLNHNNEQTLGLHIQGVLNPYFQLPSAEVSTVFKDSATYTDHNYDGYQHISEPLKIQILEHQNNHLDQHPYDHQTVGNFDHYGLPSYAHGAHVINTMIGQHPDFLPLPIMPHYNNHQLDSPIDFNRHVHYPTSGKPNVFGVSGRMSRRSSGLGKKIESIDNGSHFQRSVGYRLRNGMLTRI